ncbi:ABC transporter substrate-binding protein [Micromonospora sp. NPDC048898]|uniref:ABC transporter substrate-binding protein n=1 Tax=Micromonospora sp. NPDC048898 TaxID=3364260 RepID=UPI003722ABAC
MNSRAGLSPVAEIPPDYFAPRVPRLRKVLRSVAVVVTVIAVLTAGALVTRFVINRCGDLRSGLTKMDGECIGVLTDASAYTFKGLESIQVTIDQENDRVHKAWLADPDGNTQYVRVALLSPLTTATNSFMSIDQIRHSVQGAYLAQHRANHSAAFKDASSPPIQLVLASPGSRQTHWEPVVRQLERMAGDDHPLVAIVGMGTSVAATRDAALHLARSSSGLPMVSAVASTDDFRDIEGFVRTTPSNTDYVAALAGYLGGHPNLNNGMLVSDASAPDLYVQDLRDAYNAQLKSYLKADEKKFFGLADNKNKTQLFANISQSVCISRSNLILYAGRALDLDDFIKSLKERACKDLGISIMVGATSLIFLENLGSDLLTNNKIKIVNAAAVHPKWFTSKVDDQGFRPDATASGGQTYDGLKKFLEDFDEEGLGGRQELADGYLVTHHDAMATAVMAIRVVNGQLEKGKLPQARDVRGQLLNLNTGSEVPGAGGNLRFTQDRKADPVGKWVPIIEIPSAETSPTPLFVTG